MLLASELSHDFPDSFQLAAWVGCLFFVAKLFNEGKKAVDGMRGEKPIHLAPSPLTVRAHEEFVNKAEFDSAMKRVEGDINSLREAIDGNREASEESRARLYARVDTVAREFQTAIEKTNNRIDTIPDRVIAQLSHLHLLKTPQ
jgi:hypothetical protein